MPKATINTYSTFEILADGTIYRAPVTKIFSEDANVRNISKEVGLFDKYMSKKSIAGSAYKSTGTEAVR